MALHIPRDHMEQLTVVNRISKSVKTTWDGKHYELGPYEEKIFSEDVAKAFKRWNIQMGSLDPRTGKIVTLVGIKELNDPCDRLEMEVLINPATGKPHIEVWDRAKLTGARPSEIVPGDNGLYQTGSWKSPQNTDLNFDGR